MFDREFWIQLAVLAGVGLFLVVMLWPTASTGKRLLRKWQVRDPSDAQVEDAVRYLKRRRLLYPWLYLAGGFLPPLGDMPNQLLAIVLAGTLLAELLALRVPRGTRRVATLAPRGLTDIAARGVLICYPVLVLAMAVHLGVQGQWARVGWIALSALVVAVVTWVAVVRPATGDEAVDLALRTRSVHVTAGLGVAMAGLIALHVWGYVGIFAWVAMANTKPVPTKIAP
ncbi:hypothetical protein GCM10017774_21740 [Lentzea cavernae]|uniref:Uncharacterized protein n=1 Tax=Lentzea cavernae TaxID=2020703 RepID=A0ABQ3M7V7_9PSEU|nr:hypothetical protein GCM10017774_21740 [Lentzea cavernae]